MKVTFELSEGRTHTHRGQLYVDGDTADVSAREREKLDRLGVIAATRSRRRSRKSKADEDDE